MTLPNPMTKQHMDLGTDDPRQARDEFADNVDLFNALLVHLALSSLTSTPATVGEGLEVIAGALRAQLNGATLLRSGAGLSVNTGAGANQIPQLDGSGRFALSLVDINAATLVDNPINTGFLAGWDATAGAPRKFRIPEVGGFTSLASQLASTSAFIDFDLSPYIALGYGDFEFIISRLKPTSDGVDLLMRTSVDNVTFDAGASDYEFAISGVNTAGTAISEGSPGATAMQLNGSATIGNNGEESYTGRVFLFRPGVASLFVHQTSQGRYFNASTVGHSVQGSGSRLSASAIAGVRFLFNTGNMLSGSIQLCGRFFPA